MKGIAFDTLEYVKKLKDAGEDEKVAEAQVKAIAAVLDDLLINHLASKSDINMMEVNLLNRIESFEFKMYKFIGKCFSIAVASIYLLQLILHFFNQK